MGNINEHDMTKRMLDKIRGNSIISSINENISTDSKTNTPEQLDEHDMTKNMLSKIRGNTINESNITNGTLITESEESEDVIKVEDDELAAEASKLTDMVGGVDLKLFEVYPKDRNVVMVGVLDNGIEFKFSKKEQVPYINVNNMRLDSETVQVVKRLEAYYAIWSGEWAEKISEYTHSV